MVYLVTYSIELIAFSTMFINSKGLQSSKTFFMGNMYFYSFYLLRFVQMIFPIPTNIYFK